MWKNKCAELKLRNLGLATDPSKFSAQPLILEEYLETFNLQIKVSFILTKIKDYNLELV